MNIKKTLSLLVVAITVAGTVSAQGYYDDDIYYDATKAKKEKAEKRKKQKAETRYDGNGGSAYYIDNQGVADYPAADTYNVSTANTRDVDEYNRRYEQPDSMSLDDFAAGDFTYTRRIERFSNPSIVSGSDDDDLKEYYYSTSSAPQINLIVNTPGYYDAWSPYAWNMWDYPYCSPSWAWNYGWGLGPWVGSAWAWNWGPSWAWRPTWAWNWGWGPSWSWSWGGPGWYPHPGHGHGHGWGGGHHAWRPTSPGAYRPHTPSGGYNSSGAAGRRPGAVNNGRYSGSRRGNAMTGSWYNYNNSSNNANSPSVGTGSRPGQRPGAVNSGSSNNNYRNSNNNSGTRRNNSNNYNNNSNNRNSNRSSFNSGSRAGSRSGSGSFGGGSRGGSRSGGGGGGRAGRR